MKDKKVLITVPAISLVDQTMEALAAQNVFDVGIIQAQHRMTDLSKPVQIGSVQTLQNRWHEGKMPEADIVLVDEVHRMFNLFSTWLLDDKWKDVPFIGFSATPWSKGLGKLYGRLFVANDIQSLIEQGVLVPFRTFAPDTPDLTSVRVVAGEFVEADLDEVMRPKKLVANIVETWKQLAHDRVTVCFCCSRAHADQVAKEFAEAGVSSGYMDCDTPLLQRQAIRQRMLDGEVQVVCNVDVVGIGVDWPEVSCIIYARPTMSDIRFVQNIGRGLRACEGKRDLLILDHSSTTQRLGFVDEVYGYHRALDDGRPKPKTPQLVLLPKECPNCHMLKPPRTAVCPNCGHKAEHHAEPVAVERGTLREYTPGQEMADLRKHLPDRTYVYHQLIWWQRKKGYKPGWVNMKFNEIYGVKFPRFDVDEDMVTMPVPELVEFIYKSLDRWKKDQYNARRREARRDRDDQRA
ncbi:MAG: hypothetical protein C5B60_04115 [Chloroflexi bacterium]|nr:MAG: hypothetical protein C5B60_04115 [Chloroflexota bacterium]